MKKTNIVSVLFLSGAALFLGSCGDATKGFYANSTFTIALPTVASLKLPSGSVNVIYSIAVTGEKSEPANDVQLLINCFQCDLLDNPTGPRLPDATDLSGYVQVSNPYIVKTDHNGQFTLLVRVQSPTAFGLDTYDAQVGVYSGSLSKVGTITVAAK